jgi:hypothetical protein
MRIGIFSDVFYPYLAIGGETRYYHLARHFVSSGDDVLVVTSRLSGCSSQESLFDGKLRIHRVGFPPHPTTRRSISRSHDKEIVLVGIVVENGHADSRQNISHRDSMISCLGLDSQRLDKSLRN